MEYFQIYNSTFSLPIGPKVGDDNLLKSTTCFIGNIQMYVFPFKSKRIYASNVTVNKLDNLQFTHVFLSVRSFTYYLTSILDKKQVDRCKYLSEHVNYKIDLNVHASTIIKKNIQSCFFFWQKA